MPNSWATILIVVLVAVLGTIAFFTYLDKPQAGIAEQDQEAAQGEVMGQINELITALEGRLEKNPKDSEALILLGNLYYDANKAEEAIDFYRQALAIDPENSNVWTDLGTMQLHNGQVDQAIQSYTRATEIDPKNQMAWFNLGVLYRFHTNQPQEAVKVWRKFLDLAPPDDPHYQSLKDEVAAMELSDK
ncbi:MAG: tetratricopeptide repeat protein [candidate division Zixibacteria bacterium]|nr:tetratricopeptide repeat protein [candidate division Zixibacteria bacterium]